MCSGALLTGLSLRLRAGLSRRRMSSLCHSAAGLSGPPSLCLRLHTHHPNLLLSPGDARHLLQKVLPDCPSADSQGTGTSMMNSVQTKGLDRTGAVTDCAGPQHLTDPVESSWIEGQREASSHRGLSNFVWSLPAEEEGRRRWFTLDTGQCLPEYDTSGLHAETFLASSARRTAPFTVTCLTARPPRSLTILGPAARPSVPNGLARQAS